MISKTLLAIALLALVQLSYQTYPQIDDPTLPVEVINAMADREMRYHHFLWHNLRENWLALPADAQHAITALGWGVPRPAVLYRENGEQVVLEDNDAGEDFLYMHRQMLKKVNEMVAGTPYGKVVGWKNCPAPGDRRWKVPDAYVAPGEPAFTAQIATMKSDDYYWNVIYPMEEELNNEDNMRKWSLGKFGAKVEFTIHQTMHIRFSELDPVGIRAIPADNVTPDIPTSYDSPVYRFLGDTYGSHVNPIFWKIHGWVDNKIEQWRKANGIETINWKGTWEGGPLATWPDLYVAGQYDPDADVEPTSTPMEQVADILIKHGADTYFKKFPIGFPKRN